MVVRNGALLTSLLPRPKPLTTSPFNLRGNGNSGPLSGPTMVSRGPSGRMLRFCQWFDKFVSRDSLKEMFATLCLLGVTNACGESTSDFAAFARNHPGPPSFSLTKILPCNA